MIRVSVPGFPIAVPRRIICCMITARSADTSLAYIADANPAEILQHHRHLLSGEFPSILGMVRCGVHQRLHRGHAFGPHRRSKGRIQVLSGLFDALVDYFIYRAVGALSSLKAGEQSGELSDSHS